VRFNRIISNIVLVENSFRFSDKIKIKFLNIIDSVFKREDSELRKLKQLKKNTNSIELQMKDDWDLRAKKNPYYFIRTVKNQSEDEFWQSGYFDRNSILENKSISNNLSKKFDTLKVLEIGCGVGRILFPMSEQFQESVGVDVSQEMVSIANKKVKDNLNCKILLNNGKDLSELPSNHFDLCYSFVVFQHIPDKKIIRNYIKEVSRVLKPNRCFRLQVRGVHYIDPVKMRLFEKPFNSTWLGAQFSSKEIYEIANENGFGVVEESGEGTEYYWLTFLLR